MPPILHSAHQKEQLSKRELERALDRFVINWQQRDYGIDAIVTLPENHNGTSEVKLSTLHFLLQLKSTARARRNSTGLACPIEVAQVHHWVKSNVSVMLVLYDITENTFYYRWMDANLIAILNQTRPNWTTHETVSVNFASTELLRDGFLEDFRKYLFSNRSNHVKVLPGQYFELHDKVKRALFEFRTVAKPFSFASSLRVADILDQKISYAIYRMAVAGPSRSGKSTLINSLLRQNISPVGMFQTTGVPIQILPSKRNQLNIFKKDRSTLTLDFTESNIRTYASQEENFENFRKVEFVSVSLINERLEKGVSFFDVPGLDDPDDEVLQHALAYVNTCNAIMYLVDVTPHLTGGFVFKSEFKRHLLELSSNLDKVFLVFNKVDILSTEQLLSLQQRVNHDLQRLQLMDKIHSKIFYISGQEGKNVGLAELENGLWTFLLDNNKFGINKLLDVCKEMAGAYNEMRDFLKAGLIDADKASQLYSTLSEIKGRLPQLKHDSTVKAGEIKVKNRLFLLSEKEELIKKLIYVLKSSPTDKPLPSSVDIKKFLLNEINLTIERANELCYEQANIYKNDVDSWIEGNLRKVRDFVDVNLQQRLLDVSPIENFHMPEVDLSDAFKMGILGTIVAALFNPYAALLDLFGGGFLAFLTQLFVSAENRRAAQIEKVVESTRANCNKVFDDFIIKLSEATDELVFRINDYASEKVSLYFSDMEKEIKELSTGPLTPEIKARFESAFGDIENNERRLGALIEELFLHK